MIKKSTATMEAGEIEKYTPVWFLVRKCSIMTLSMKVAMTLIIADAPMIALPLFMNSISTSDEGLYQCNCNGDKYV